MKPDIVLHRNKMRLLAQESNVFSNLDNYRMNASLWHKIGHLIHTAT